MIDPKEITDGIHAGVEVRQQRGLEIAALAKIEQKDGFYIVPSVTNPRPTRYRVKVTPVESTCTCVDFETRGCKCKHIYAVEYTIRRERSVTVEPGGATTVRESVTVTQTRKTYPQDWPAYNEAQTNEKREFQSLLHDLCKDVGELPADAQRKGPQGRKPLPLSQAIFCAVFKIYSTVIKSKFGDAVRSKTDVAAKNEVLCKVLAHNICCLISAMYELGIEPTFSPMLGRATN
jgi:hypothetical protein